MTTESLYYSVLIDASLRDAFNKYIEENSITATCNNLTLYIDRNVTAFVVQYHISFVSPEIPLYIKLTFNPIKLYKT